MSYTPPPPPGYGGQGYGGYARPKASGKAITSLVLGIVSIVPCCAVGVIFGVISIILGNAANREIAASNGTQSGAGLARAGVITGVIGVVVCVLYWILVFAYGSVDLNVNTSP
jgi:hypothetical protein